MQTKLHSLFESIVNTIVSMLLYGATLAVTYSITQDPWLNGFMIALISTVKNYLIRRLGVWREQNE